MDVRSGKNDCVPMNYIIRENMYYHRTDRDERQELTDEINGEIIGYC